jgi:hypothetical protein
MRAGLPKSGPAVRLLRVRLRNSVADLFLCRCRSSRERVGMEHTKAEMADIVNAAWEQVLGQTGASEPDWEPLERAVPEEWLGGWMFMGYLPSPDGRAPLRAYKHGITRRYLHLRLLGDRLEAFRYQGERSYAPATVAEEVEDAYATIEHSGATRETVYDDAYRDEKHRRLAEAGYTVIHVTP